MGFADGALCGGEDGVFGVVGAAEGTAAWGLGAPERVDWSRGEHYKALRIEKRVVGIWNRGGVQKDKVVGWVTQERSGAGDRSTAN